MITTLESLVRDFKLTPYPITDTVRRRNNCFARNERGKIRALSLSDSAVESVVLDDEA